MANWFEIKLPLIDPQGNFGNFLGDGASAPRYTEVRLSQYSMECIIGSLKETKNAVDWYPNYDNTEVQPEFMPVEVPNLLINGGFGIGFGIKTDIPKHNVGEVIDATIALMKNPNTKILLYPDQCMPVDILSTEFKQICNTGHGSYAARAVIDVEDFKGGRQALVIKSVPDMVFFDSVKEKIEKLMQDKVLSQVSDIIGESSDNEMRSLIVLKKGSDPEFVKQILYQKTELEKRYTVNFEVLMGTENIRLSYKAYLESFIDFRRMTKFRVYCNRLQPLQTRLHRIDAYIKALESGDIDMIMDTIRKQKQVNDNELVDFLIKKLKITDMQASYIINAPNKTLSIGYFKKYKDESAEILETIDGIMKIINDTDAIDLEIIQELQMYKKKYGSPRISRLVDSDTVSDIPKGDFNIVITDDNFIKKMPASIDMVGSGAAPKFFIKGCNSQNILLFNEMGKVFKLPISKIPMSDKSSVGTDMRFLIKNSTANLISVVYEPVLEDLAGRVTKHFLTIVTVSGLIKKIDLDDITNTPPSGIIFIKLDKNDRVAATKLTGLNSDVIVYSDHSALRIKVKDVPHQKRNTKGVRSMAMGEKIDGMSIVHPDTNNIIVVTDKGYVNRFDSVALPVVGRNKSGSKVIKLKQGDSIKSIIAIDESDNIIIRTTKEIIKIPVKDIAKGSSVSSGDKIITLKNDTILSVGKQKEVD